MIENGVNPDALAVRVFDSEVAWRLLTSRVQTVIKDLRKEGAAQKHVSNAPIAE